MAGRAQNLNHGHDDAATWISRIERGLTASEQDQFSAWIAEDPEHAELLARQSALLTAVQTVSSIAAPPPMREAQGSKPASLMRRRVQAWAAAGALAASVILMIGVSLLGDTPQVNDQSGPLRLAAAHTVQSEQLADGSHLWLDARTDVGVALRETERRVQLAQGGVFAEVAPDQDRPFVVETHGVSVTAVGTAFEVQARNGSVSVLVEEGIVRVMDPALGEPGLLEAGQAMRRSMGGVWGPPSPAETIAGWRTGRIRVQSERASDLAKQLSLYRQAPILIDGVELSGIRVSGVFSIHQEDSESMVLALADSVEACAAPQPSGAIVITRNTLLCP